MVETKMAERGAHFDEETLQKLYKRVICRKHEIQTLLTLFGTRASFSCPAIFVCGHTATGKSFVVRTLLKDFEVRWFNVGLVYFQTSGFYSFKGLPRVLFSEKDTVIVEGIFDIVGDGGWILHSKDRWFGLTISYEGADGVSWELEFVSFFAGKWDLTL